MKKHLIQTLLLTTLVMGLSACRTTTPKVDHRALTKAPPVTVKTNTEKAADIEYKGNQSLSAAVSYWLGTPYRTGGSSRKGTDCSGLASQIYRSVYHVSLPRTSNAQYSNSNKVSKSDLQEGDLVFFSSNRSGKRVAHSGVYLKDGKFIHASISRGVIISHLNEEYYRRHWISGGRYK